MLRLVSTLWDRAGLASALCAEQASYRMVKEMWAFNLPQPTPLHPLPSPDHHPGRDFPHCHLKIACFLTSWVFFNKNNIVMIKKFNKWQKTDKAPTPDFSVHSLAIINMKFLMYSSNIFLCMDHMCGCISFLFYLNCIIPSNFSLLSWTPALP